MFLVAEIGVNWDGNFKLVEKMIQKSKDIGCNAVKFQAFNEYMIKNHPHKKRLIKSAINKENISKIDEISKSNGIEWFCTPMYESAIELLDPYVNRYKIRESDGRSLLKNKTTPLIEKILETKKQMIVSVNKSPKKSQFKNNKKIKWLYCVPKYPCSLEEVNFRKIIEFDGYSNHVNNLIAPLVSVVLGSKILEIHVTNNKKINYFDNNVSLDFNELEKLIKNIKLIEKIKR